MIVAMLVIMIMSVCVAMIVIVPMVMAVPVSMPVAVSVVMMMMVMPAIGPMDMGFGLGRKSTHHRRDRHANAAQHFLDVRVAQNKQRIVADFNECMVAAQVPRRAHQPRRIAAGDLGQFFLRCAHQHEAAIFQLQRITIA